MTTILTSPLSQVQANSLDQLFNKQPDLLTDEEVEKIVNELLKMRVNWLEEEKKPKTKKAAADPGLKMEDLDI